MIKSQNSVKKAIDLSKMINNMPRTPTKRSKTHEHKPDNNIRLQITIDCRIL